MQRYGFFGGCFNPPTIAHLELVKKSIKIANLDKVFFVPMGDYYKKIDLVPAGHRYNMLKILVENEQQIKVSRIQMDQNKRLYAIDTLKIIAKEFVNSENFFIMGTDNYKKVRNWKNSEELLKNFNYIILDRGDFFEDIIPNNVIIIEEDYRLKQISSSLVRKKVSNNDNIDDLVTQNIKNYILENELYK